MPRPRQAVDLSRVALAIEDAAVAADVARVLLARGIPSEPVTIEHLAPAPDGAAAARSAGLGRRLLAYAPEQPPTVERVAALEPLCRAAARAGTPVVTLCAAPRAHGRLAWDRAAALAYLASSGAVICHDPDIWLETICFVMGYGLPRGPRVAVVAAPGSFLAASAIALGNEADLVGNRFPLVAASTTRLEPTDVALVDLATLGPSTPEKVGQAVVVPLVGRAELVGDPVRMPLVGLRAALGAVVATGELAERIAVGLGPSPSTQKDPALLAALSPDLERVARQLDKLDAHDLRTGDHETKVLLSAWGIPVTRQAVATTPSAAIRVARKAGFPVEIKPWGPDQLSEREGCPVQHGLATAADVKRAMVTVTSAAGLPDDAPVIVRAAPPRGRELSARILQVGPLGWMVNVEIEGVMEPLAARAPLRPLDAERIARRVEASRVGDPEPDRDALIDMLVRASHLVVHHSDIIEALHLHRIVVAPRGETSMVVDAQAVLAPRP